MVRLTLEVAYDDCGTRQTMEVVTEARTVKEAQNKAENEAKLLCEGYKMYKGRVKRVEYVQET